jgi:hypothetical protein
MSAEISPTAQTNSAPRRQRDDHPVDAQAGQDTAEERGGDCQTDDHGVGRTEVAAMNKRTNSGTSPRASSDMAAGSASSAPSR